MFPFSVALVSWCLFSAMAVIYAIARLAMSRNDIDARRDGMLLLGGIPGLIGAPRIYFWMLTGA